ncbi:MAG: patatin-like phospholipase family protein [Thermodesulfovibrionales bacterium]
MKRPERTHIGLFCCLGFMFLLMPLLSSCGQQRSVQPARQPARIAVVLGAGAARGFAHIGVLKVLEANKVPFSMIVGSSAGSFVGSLSAYGFSAFQIQKMALAIEKEELVDLVIPDNGFIKGEKIESYINAALRNTPIEKLRVPFYAVATSLPGGQEVAFGSGNTGTAVRASCAIPGVFRPVKIGSQLYVDGGVTSPVPVDAARRYGADIVIAVDISSDPDRKSPASTMETMLQSIGIMYGKLAAAQLNRADVVIRPRVGSIGSSDFDSRHDAVLEGEKAALEAMPRIQALLNELRASGRLE